MKQVSFTFGVGMAQDGLPLMPNEVQSALSIIQKEASQIFGGYTLYKAQGGWLDGPRLIQEDSMTLMVLTDLFGHERVAKVEELRQIIKTQLNQKAIAVSQIPCEFSIQ